MKDSTIITINGKEFTIDESRAKSLGIIKPVRPEHEFAIGDVYSFSCDPNVFLLVVPHGWQWFTAEPKFNLIGSGNQIKSYSMFPDGATRHEMQTLLDNPISGTYDFVKNVEKDIIKICKNAL